MKSTLPAERLLIVLSFAVLTESESAEALKLAESADGDVWDELWSLAKLNATEPLIWSNAKKLGLSVPAAIADRFEARSEEIRRANDARLKTARAMFAQFAENNIPVVILKGVLFAETLYGNPYYKKMNDVDILVRRGDLEAIYAIYDKMGFFSAAELVGGNPRKQEKFSHHAPPFFSRDLKCMVGTHWGLITPLAPYTIDYDAIWSRVTDVDFHGVPAKSMCDEDNLHHLCVHLPYYKTGVRELADIYNLIRKAGKSLRWNLLLSEIEKAKTWNLVFHALSLTHAIHPTPETGKFIKKLKPKTSWYFRNDTERKIQSLSLLLRSRSTHLSRIEKAFADLNATKAADEKRDAFGRMWSGMLLPPMEDVARMNSVESPGTLDRAFTPIRIFRVFGRDVGNAMFWTIMAKCGYEVASSTTREVLNLALSAVGKTSKKTAEPQNYEAFARKLGVTVEDLQRLKDSLE